MKPLRQPAPKEKNGFIEKRVKLVSSISAVFQHAYGDKSLLPGDFRSFRKFQPGKICFFEFVEYSFMVGAERVKSQKRARPVLAL